MNIIALSFDMAQAVEGFVQRVRRFFYSVILLCHRCPYCNGSVQMAGEGRCQCSGCGSVFDPTVQFQRCSACGGMPVLKVRRYECSECGQEIISRFLFDGLVFDGEYFRQRMAESRQRKEDQRERIRQMLAEGRSGDLALEATDLAAMPGLIDALNSLTEGLPVHFDIDAPDGFDLKRYESHVLAHACESPLSLREISPLTGDLRKDVIWRFIAIIFLAHAGIIDVWQQGPEIMVKKREAYGKGQGIPGELEEPNGIEGPVGGVEAG